MHIWIVYPHINQPGGINTWTENLITGLRFHGHTVDLSYATLGSGMRIDPNVHTRMGVKVRGEDRLPGTVVPYGTEQNIRDYVQRAEGYDIVLFAQPSPHDTKAYNDPDMMWLRLYSDSPVPVVAVFHDNSWKQTNPWVRSIAPYCECILHAQHMFYEYSMGTVGGEPFAANDNLVTWVSFPIASESVLGLYDANKVTDPLRQGICLAQWVGWKNHKYLLPQLCDVQSFQLTLYGAGIQYYYQRKKGCWKCAIGHDEVTGEVHSNSPHVYAGYVSYSDIPDQLILSSFTVDASTRGRENMAMIEPMAYGAVSIITEDVLASSPWQKLTEDFVVAAPLGEIGLAIEDVCLNFEMYRSERLAGIEFVRKYHTIEGVANRMLKMFAAVLDGEVGLHPEGLGVWLE